MRRGTILVALLLAGAVLAPAANAQVFARAYAQCYTGDEGQSRIGTDQEVRWSLSQGVPTGQGGGEAEPILDIPPLSDPCYNTDDDDGDGIEEDEDRVTVAVYLYDIKLTGVCLDNEGPHLTDQCQYGRSPFLP